MMYFKNEDEYNRNYRKVEAMYWKGYSNDTIVNNMYGIPRFIVLEMIQKVFALDQKKKERYGS